MSKKDVISKGKYRFPQPGGAVSVKDYIILREEGKKYLLLRFLNERNEKVDALTMRLTQMDGSGKKISSEIIPLENLSGGAGAAFVPQVRLPLANGCEDFRVDILTSVYGKFVYSPARAGMRVDYNGQEKKPAFDTAPARRRMRGKSVVVTRRKVKGSVAIMLLCLVLLAAAFAATAAFMEVFNRQSPAFSVSDIEYTFLEDKEPGSPVAVTGYRGRAGDIVIPAEIGGYRVQQIAESAFEGNRWVRSVEIEGVIPVGAYAFYGCANLKSFDFDGVSSVGDYAFASCSALEEISSASLVSVGEGAFSNCVSLKRAVFTADAQEELQFGKRPFYFCTALEEFTADRDIDYVGGTDILYGAQNLQSLSMRTLHEDGAALADLFGGWEAPSALETVSFDELAYIPASFCENLTSLRSFRVKQVGEALVEQNAFRGCTSLAEFDIGTPVRTAGAHAFRDTALISFDASALRSVGTSAFRGCTGLTSFDLSRNTSLTALPDMLLADCTALSSVILSQNIETLGDSLLEGCTNLRSVTFAKNGALRDLGNATFRGCTSLSSVTVPDTVPSIGGETFAGCTRLAEVALPGTVTSFGDGAFMDCGSLRTFELPEQLRTLGAKAFMNCSLLAQIGLGSVASIGEYAFAYCTSLEEVSVPSTVRSFAEGIFKGCKALTSLSLPYLGISPNAPCSLAHLCGNAVPASLARVELREALQLADGAFLDCSGIEEIVLNEGLRSVGSEAFYNCSRLTDLVIPDSVTTMGYACFALCSSLRSLTLPFVGDGSTYNGSIGYNFGSQDNTANMPYFLTTVTLTSRSYLTDYAFCGADRLEQVVCAEPITSIGNYAFAGCSSLKEIPVTDALARVGEYAFAGCGFGSFTLPDGVEHVGFGAFAECDALTSLTLPFVGEEAYSHENGTLAYLFGAGYYEEAYKYIPAALSLVTVTQPYPVMRYAFYGAQGLETAELADGVTEIGEYAFASSGIRSIDLPESLYSIGNDAFRYCRFLTYLELPASLGMIYDGAFDQCYNLREVRNFSPLFVRAGSESNGSVARYAINVYEGNESESPRTTTADGYLFIRGENAAWYLCGYPEKGALTLPSAFYYGVGRLTSYEIPPYLFAWDDAVASVLVSSAVDAMGEGAFKDCTALTEVSFASGSALPEIGYESFSGCTSLREIALPEDVGSIGDLAFYGCGSLRKVTLGENVTRIGSDAFYGCRRLYEIYDYCPLTFEAGSEGYGSIARYAIVIHTSPYEQGLQYITVNGLEFARLGSEWTLVEVTEEVTSLTLGTFSYEGGTISGYDVAPYLMADNFSLEELYIGDGVRSVGDYAFQNCSSLRVLDIDSETLEHIGISAFENCWSVYSLGIRADALRTIGDNAFRNDTSLDEVVIEAGSFERIGANAFAGCYGIRSMEMTRGPQVIAEGAFSGCGSMQTLVLGEGVLEIGANAFFECSSLRTLALPDGLETIGESAFMYTYNLTGLTFGQGLMHIGANAFRSSGAKGSLELPEGLRSIGEYAFAANRGLYSLSLPSTLEEIGESAFTNCVDLFEVYNASRLQIAPGSEAFGGVARYAVAVLSPGAESILAFEDGFVFAREGTSWRLMLLEEEKAAQAYWSIALPQRFTHNGTTVEQYTIDSGAFRYGGGYHVDLFVPAGASAHTDLNTGVNTVYYYGTREQWTANFSGSSWQNAHVLVYADCVHEEGQWTYDEYGNVLTWVNTYEDYRPPLCEENGYRRTVCSVCGDVLFEEILEATGHSCGPDGTCDNCGKQGVAVTAENFASLGWLTNDKDAPFTVREDGALISSNHADGSASALTLKADKIMQVFVWAETSCGAGDRAVCRLNGEERHTADGEGEAFFTFMLSANDVLTLCYEKDGADSMYGDEVLFRIVIFPVEAEV